MAAHLASVLAPGHGGPVQRAVLAAMAAACLPCVLTLWRSPGPRVWRTTGVMYGGMLTVHLLMLMAGTGQSVASHAAHLGAGHPGSAATSSAAGWAELTMGAGIMLAGVQVVLAGALLLTQRRQRPALRSARAGAPTAC
ncbi:MAG TPA: hypothetical protein VGO74_15690 [Modestobacter sp.]|nr:hypothetical protein [Modestobacter sp.]